MRQSGLEARDRRGIKRRVSEGWHHLTVDGSYVRTHCEEVDEFVEASGSDWGEIFKVVRKKVARTGPLPRLSRIGVPFAVRHLSSTGVSLRRDRLLWLLKVAVAACVGTVKPRGNNGSGRTHQAA